MASNTQYALRFRAAGGAAGAPADALTAELAWNQQDGFIYGGFGDDGSGYATSIKKIAAMDFVGNVPAGGAEGQILAKLSSADGDWGWTDAPEGGGGGGMAIGRGAGIRGMRMSMC